MNTKESQENQKDTNKVVLWWKMFWDYIDTDKGTFYKQASSFYRFISTIILLFAAGGLIGYEIFIFANDVYEAYHNSTKGIKGIPTEKIFYALILSTTSLAFVGMHYVINVLIKKEHESNDSNKELRWQDFAIFFSLMLCAILLVGLILTYKKYFPEPPYWLM